MTSCLSNRTARLGEKDNISCLLSDIVRLYSLASWVVLISLIGPRVVFGAMWLKIGLSLSSGREFVSNGNCNRGGRGLEGGMMGDNVGCIAKVCGYVCRPQKDPA